MDLYISHQVCWVLGVWYCWEMIDAGRSDGCRIVYDAWCVMWCDVRIYHTVQVVDVHLRRTHRSDGACDGDEWRTWWADLTSVRQSDRLRPTCRKCAFMNYVRCEVMSYRWGLQATVASSSSTCTRYKGTSARMCDVHAYHIKLYLDIDIYVCMCVSYLARVVKWVRLRPPRCIVL
jgi:hypothetical protein